MVTLSKTFQEDSKFPLALAESAALLALTHISDSNASSVREVLYVESYAHQVQYMRMIGRENSTSNVAFG